VGADVPVELVEKREVFPDMAYRQFVRVRENVGWNTALSQRRVQFQHRLDRREDVGEKFGEFVERAVKPGGRLHFGEKLLLAHPAGFEAKEQRGVVDEFLHFGGGHFAARRDSPSGDAIIKIHQHFAEIEDDCLGSGHDQWISRRPSSARLSVSSSTNSNPLPAGKPWAMREVFTDLVESRLAR